MKFSRQPTSSFSKKSIAHKTIHNIALTTYSLESFQRTSLYKVIFLSMHLAFLPI